MTQKELAAAVGTYAVSKIYPLQSSYLGNGASCASARATLARLRRLNVADGNSLMAVGEQLFAGWPEDDLGSPERCPKAFEAVCSTLSLYALHQQSKDKPMALTPEAKKGMHTSGSRMQGSLGSACRLLKPNLEEAKGIQRRLSTVEAARDFDSLYRRVRALVQLLKAGGIPLDYWQLARDLYLVQFRYERDAVMRRWAQDYYCSTPENSKETS